VKRFSISPFRPPTLATTTTTTTATTTTATTTTATTTTTIPCRVVFLKEGIFIEENYGKR